MTQIVVTLENDADGTFLQRMIENMKGVLRTTLKNKVERNNSDKDSEEWISKMHDLSDDIDSSILDMNDERTRYIMSK